MQIEAGPCAQFSVYHLMDLEPGEEGLMLHDKPGDGLISQTNGSNNAESTVAPTAIPLLRSTVAIYGTGLPDDTLPQEAPVSSASQPNRAEEGPKVPLGNPKNLSDISEVLRSKNAGPFEITLDAMFVSRKVFDLIRDSGMLTTDNVAKALGIAPDDIIWIGFYEPALAFKVTIPRLRGGKRVAAGGFLENDVHGSQKHMGLARMLLPPGLAEQLAS